MKDTRWVFIRPCNYSPYYDPEMQEPLGLQYLSASRKKKKESVLLLDAVLDSMKEIKLARRAVSFMPDAIGFSIMTGQEVESVIAIYNECKRVLKEKKVHWLAGGNFITYETDQALKILPEDFIMVRFEGENALEQLSSSWLADHNSDDDKTEPGQRVIISPNVKDLNTLNFPSRPFADHIMSMDRAFNIQGSRGCCGGCKYCSSPGARNPDTAHWRGRSIENIVAEMAELNKRFQASSFNIIDEDFLGPNKLSLKRAREFTQELNARELKISFSIQVRPDSLNNEIIDLLSANGLCYIFIGIESDDYNDFKRWGRPWVNDPWQLVARLQSNNVEVGAGVLLFHPESTFTGIHRFATILQKYKLLNYRSAINRMDAMPGSVFYKTKVQTGGLNQTIGPQQLDFNDKKIDCLYKDLAIALCPLGPPSMHALCALPPLIAKCRRFKGFDDNYNELKRIIEYFDASVAETLFGLLDHHMKENVNPDFVLDLQKQNFQTALTGAKDLFKYGFAVSFDELRNAIQIDSGL